ncbi:MAG: phosphoribosylformylglycinamidine synthase subunit PurL [Acidobacteriota bacterium]
MIDQKIIKDHNLTEEEFQKIVELIGREPNLTELGIFSLMWSEHCSYKSSKNHLKKFPISGERVIQGPGENAGIIDIGEGMAAVFKIESHNHPSFIEPYQGAATGVGGILRDIFTMGARPIALLDSLRFGPLENQKNKVIMEGVVSGISGYGNSTGVPTVGGEVYFNKCYSLNPLVNVFCLGLARKNKIFYAKAEGIGNPVLYVGSKTGRDGIHGATMASAEFDDDFEQKRPNVQVGDPFKEKLLLEACLEIMAKDLIIGIQDMGAAGLTCSTTEMASKSGAGIEIDLDLVPQREEDMTPPEIMLSESQERMLLVAKKDKVEEIQKIFSKWDLDAVVIGKVVEGGQLKVKYKSQVVVDIPVNAVVNLCPVYHREGKEPTERKANVLTKLPPAPINLEQDFLRLLSSPTIACKEWIYRQYDHMVQINTVFLPGADASLLRLKGKKKAIAISLDGNSLYCRLEPKKGGKIAVAEACRNLTCVGAYPVGVTNCLNFGNPEKPEVMWEFKEVVEGIAEACRDFNIPITGGNVSFYNETGGKSIFPTPVVGVVGLIDDIKLTVDPGFKEEGDFIFLIGNTREELGGSEYLKEIHRQELGPVPEIDLELEKKVQLLCRQAINKKLLRSAHDLSEGGLAAAISESCFWSPRKLGSTIYLEPDQLAHVFLFSESQSRILVSLKKEKDFLALSQEVRVPVSRLGQTGGKMISFIQGDKSILSVPVEQAYFAWKNSLPNLFNLLGEKE